MASVCGISILCIHNLCLKFCSCNFSFQFLEKGHLSESAAFVYHAEQRVSNNYANVVPQFRSSNNGDWKYLEAYLHDYVVDNGMELGKQFKK